MEQKHEQKVALTVTEGALVGVATEATEATGAIGATGST